MAIDLRNFYFDSDYEVDTLIYKRLNSVSVAHHNSRTEAVTLTIPHGLVGMTPLMRGVWSKDAFANSAIPFGTSDIIKQTDTGDFYRANFWLSEVLTAVYSDATNVYIYIYNIGPTFTMTYKVYGIHGGEDVDIASNSNLSTPFMLSSDLNKLKVWKQGGDTLSLPSGGSANASVIHELPYIKSGKILEIGGKKLLKI